MSSKEIDIFILILTPYLKNDEGELYLYGSRADDSLKGGDIDLLLVLPTQEKSRELIQNQFQILSDFKKHLGERIIDLSIISQFQLRTEPFYLHIFPAAVLLNKWHSK